MSVGTERILKTQLPLPSSSTIGEIRSEADKKVAETASRANTVTVPIILSATAPVLNMPVRVEDDHLIIEPHAMQIGLFYPVEFEGRIQLIRKTKDAKIEFYEVLKRDGGDTL